MPRRQQTDGLDADISCHLCSSITDLSDLNWLCLCTPEVRRVHRTCSTIRGGKSKRCSQCGLENQYDAVSEKRRSARVIVIGAGPAGESTTSPVPPHGLRFARLSCR